MFLRKVSVVFLQLDAQVFTKLEALGSPYNQEFMQASSCKSHQLLTPFLARPLSLENEGYWLGLSGDQPHPGVTCKPNEYFIIEEFIRV